MKCAVLFSGGKDSAYAAFLEKEKGNEIACLITIFSENPESYMFHTPSITKVEKQAEAMNIPLLVQKTKGEKEKELDDLESAIKKAIEKYQINAVITGAVESVYQASRIQKICDKLKIECFNPLWHINPDKYWDEFLENKFELIIIAVAADGLGEEWLGKKINRTSLEKLKEIEKKYRIHPLFEGGEAETFVVDCPLFYKKLKIMRAEKIFFRNNGIYDLKEIELIDK